MEKIELRPIGVVHSPFRERSGTARQAAGAMDVTATIELRPEYAEGLVDLAGFSHIMIVFFMHRMEETSLTAFPPWDNRPHGVFSTCSPYRPNHLGVSVVRLEKIEGTQLTIRGVDMVDGSPVLDIKPYIPDLYPREEVRAGWLADKAAGMIHSRSGDRQVAGNPEMY